MNWTIPAVKNLEMSSRNVHKFLKYKVKLVRTTAERLVECLGFDAGRSHPAMDVIQ